MGHIQNFHIGLATATNSTPPTGFSKQWGSTVTFGKSDGTVYWYPPSGSDCAYKLDAAGTGDTFEAACFFMTFPAPTVTEGKRYGVVLRGSGATNTENGYLYCLEYAGTSQAAATRTLKIYRFDAGAETLLASVPIDSIIPSCLDTAYVSMRARVETIGADTFHKLTAINAWSGLEPTLENENWALEYTEVGDTGVSSGWAGWSARGAYADNNNPATKELWVAINGSKIPTIASSPEISISPVAGAGYLLLEERNLTGGSAGITMSSSGTLAAGVAATGSAALRIDVSGSCVSGLILSGSIGVGLSGGDTRILTGALGRGSASIGLFCRDPGMIIGVSGRGSGSIGLSTARKLVTGPFGADPENLPRILVATIAKGSAYLELFGSGSLKILSAGVVLPPDDPVVIIPGDDPVVIIPAGDFEAWCLNVETFGHARYTNYPMVSLFVLNGKEFGITEDGIESLLGDTDRGVAITPRIRSGKTDFGGSVDKRFVEAILLVRTGAELTVTTTRGEQDIRVGYTVQPNGVAGMHRRRRKLSEGPRASVWEFEVAADGIFDISEIGVLVEKLGRSK